MTLSAGLAVAGTLLFLFSFIALCIMVIEDGTRQFETLMQMRYLAFGVFFGIFICLVSVYVAGLERIMG